jgi:hypothetical protein
MEKQRNTLLSAWGLSQSGGKYCLTNFFQFDQALAVKAEGSRHFHKAYPPWRTITGHSPG